MNGRKSGEKIVIIGVIAACVVVTIGFIILFLNLNKDGEIKPRDTDSPSDSLAETKGESIDEPKTAEPETTGEPGTESVTASESDTEPEITTAEPATQPPVIETQPPVTETQPPVIETQPPVPQTEPPAPPQTQPPATDPVDPPETQPPFVTTGRPVVTSYPVVASERVDDSFFSDAVFIGDSRTQGLQIYGDIKNAVYYACQGLNVITAQNNTFINENGQALTIAQALALHPEYRKIYICLGVNEFWLGEGTYKANYEILIDSIMAANPNAAIYMYAITPLRDGLASSANGLNNTKMASFNNIAKDIAMARGIYYVDVSEAFIKPDGGRRLDDSESSDGIHLNTYGVSKITEYFRTHTK